MHAYIHTYIIAYIHTLLYRKHALIYYYIHTYIRTYITTYKHTLLYIIYIYNTLYTICNIYRMRQGQKQAFLLHLHFFT